MASLMCNPSGFAIDGISFVVGPELMDKIPPFKNSAMGATFIF